ncbi:stalk domain-containing protein [Paenibacillus gansuensis]|uniref:Stalk domain-containing protein n=1 Tax=Paenibacillus gansuensis TaxID=306542 RepID=A0ABW5PBZ8_9BACL
MKLRRIVILTLAISLLGTASVFADSIGQRVRVFVNNNETSDPGINVDGKTMLSLREMSEALGAIITWDDETKDVRVFKPNVHMILLDTDKSQLFNEVERGKANFVFISQTDNLLADVYSFKVLISDPYGNAKDIVPETVFTEQKDTYNTRTKPIDYDFKYSGKYTISYMMKLSRNADYQTVGKKVITSRSTK